MTTAAAAAAAMEGGGGCYSVRWAFNTRQWHPSALDWTAAISLVQGDERDRISRFAFRRDAKSALAGRLLLRRLAAEVLGVPWGAAAFTRTEHGRPRLAEGLASNQVPNRPEVDFNVSHQGAWAVLAAEGGGSQVGVDVMEVAAPPGRPVDAFLGTMSRQFSGKEWEFIVRGGGGGTEIDRLSAFYRLWCLKESVIKATGHGLTFPLRRLSFTPAGTPMPASYALQTRVEVDGTPDPTWHFQETMLDGAHPVAVALHRTHTHAPAALPTPPPPFTVLTYQQLTSAATPLTPPDPTVGEEFMGKAEAPSL